MIDIVASALTFEHWASTQQQEQGHRLCRSQSTSSTHSTDSDTNTRIYRQNMPHLERPIVPHMRLIESLPNLSLYDAWCWFDKWKWWLFFYYNDNNNNQKLKQDNQKTKAANNPSKNDFFDKNYSKSNKTTSLNNAINQQKNQIDQSTKLKHDDDDYFFRRKKHFPELEEEKRTTWTERPITILSQTHNKNNTIGWRPKDLLFETLKLESQILKLQI